MVLNIPVVAGLYVIPETRVIAVPNAVNVIPLAIVKVPTYPAVKIKFLQLLLIELTVQLGLNESKLASVPEVGTPLPEPSVSQFPAVPHKPSNVVFLQVGITQ